MIQRLLVANRGEIARRVFRTCRDLGIETVAVHSDADAQLPFVTDADVAVRLPGNTPAETYLRADLVIEAALRTGADAVHPGYGFLSENAAFAQQVIDAGLVWVGPSPAAITAMGDKVRAKELMHAAGVPVLGQLEPAAVTAFELPVIVKASAGGGGRGMRIVRDADRVEAEVSAAAAEAESAFGDGTVFVETYVEHGRHIEVQVLGTDQGTLVFGERDCSLQRRHQKVVEEAPAPGLPEQTRKELHEAARAAAEAIDYRGAGTVEFLYSPVSERFYFLEMNTRLQVEHPVTEQIYGVDLVALQIAVAEGREVTVAEESPRGHAIEVRLYAENPAADYAPQTGRLLELEIEHHGAFALDRHGIRLDTGFESGDEVGTFYDAMLAKVIAWAPTRDQAARSLARALERARIHGLVTNRDQLVASLRHRAFGDLSGVATSFYDEYPETLEPAAADDLAAFAGAIALAEYRRGAARVQARIPAGFRNVVTAPLVTVFEVAGERIEVFWHGGRAGYRLAASVDGDGGSGDGAARSVTVLGASAEEVTLDVDGVVRRYRARVVDGVAGPEAVLVDGPRGGATLKLVPRFTDPSTQVAAGSLLAPMPGTVVAVRVAAGDQVTEGQPLVVMEAMKMQHVIAAPYDGTVTEIGAAEGDQVEAGAVLAVVSAPENESAEGDQ